jgi:Flp pilus assembly protein TadD
MADELTDPRPALMQTALSQLRVNRFAEGIDTFRLLLEIDANVPDAWFNLAWMERQTRQYQRAADSYAQAIARGVSRPAEARVNRAVLLSEHLNDVAAAEAELQAAVRDDPEFLPAWLNLGNLYEDLGDADKAHAAYVAAAAIVPDCGRAIGRRAMIDVHRGEIQPAIAALKTAVASASRDPLDIAELHFALGHALDAAGDHDAAFAAIATANAASLRTSAVRPGYNRAGHEALIDTIIAAFPTRVPAATAPDPAAPVFICGMFRSGSTLTEQMLARHSRVTAGGELEFIPAMVAELLQPYPAPVAGLDAAGIAALRARYLAELAVVHPHYDVLTDKRPDNFLHIGLIKLLFPAAKIVHSFRNPLDNLISVFFANFHPVVKYDSNVEDIAHWYAQYRRLMAHWKSLYGDEIFEMDYDAAVADPRPMIERLLAHCGLEWEDQCAGASPAGLPIRTPSAWAVRQPLHARSSGRWQHYAAHLGGARAILGV